MQNLDEIKFRFKEKQKPRNYTQELVYDLNVGIPLTYLAIL